jgi:hypothetical protein
VTERDDGPGEGQEENRHRRGLKFRRRDDYAVELFKEAQTNLADVARVDRILLELGRFYNPYINAAIVDLDTRRKILERLAAGDQEEAARLLEHRLTLYSRDPGTSE